MIDYIETDSGILFHFMQPQPDEINIVDIAVALARLPRFNGHSRLSVAVHSLLVADLLRHKFPSQPDLLLCGLLHDAAEAYVGDIPRPIKEHLTIHWPGQQYTVIEHIKQIEAQILEHILQNLLPGFDPRRVSAWQSAIRKADDMALRYEAEQILCSPHLWWRKLPTMPSDFQPASYVLDGNLRAAAAADIFLARYDALRAIL